MLFRGIQRPRTDCKPHEGSAAFTPLHLPKALQFRIFQHRKKINLEAA
jgi:hypothetical protein